MRNFGLIASVSAAIFSASQSFANDNVMVVFDGSNSMWGQIDGTAKIEIARGVMDNLLGDWVEGRSVGLMAYGHRRRGDCTDIEVLVTPGQEARESILERINDITPTGKTPLTDAVEQAAQALSYTDQPATVVLISDGLESCERDPCALAQALEKGGVAFTAHVVGFGLTNDEDAASLSCIAEETGGKYITAGNADELEAALSAVSTAVAEVVPEPTPEPEPEPEPETPDVAVQGPATAVGGSAIEVTWTPQLSDSDYINVVPVGTDADVFGSYVRIGNKTELSLPVPGDEGLYEIRYLTNPDRQVLGHAIIEVTKPEVELTAADTVETGAMLNISWTPTINRRDYVAIVPVGADAGEFGNYQSIGNKTEADIRAPADPGLYELRYILNIDKRTVASKQIEVTNPQVVLQVPDTAKTGEAFEVSWGGTVNPQDYITIVPMGADEGEFGNYVTVRDASKAALDAPAETGLYEVRYLLREGNKTMASEPIEIIAPEVTISGPSTVVTGATFDVSWTGTVNMHDYVAIVPAGSNEGEFGNYLAVRDAQTGELTAPADPGLYELRYILREGSKTLATSSIEVTQPEITITAPETVLAGSKFEVSWTGTVNAQDYINIVPMGTDEGTFGNYLSVRENSKDMLQAPSETGIYELRYVLRAGTKTMATAMVEITEPEVTISAPAEVRAGDKLRVSWTGTVNSNDYINLVPVGSADDAFGVYSQVRDNAAHDLTAPEDTGLYEIRYLLREGSRVLARQTVEILASDAPLASGANLDAPDTAAPGSTIEVSWSTDGAGSDQRITVARSEQAIFTWISATKITGAPPMQITLPDDQGVYEIRLLDLSSQAVLARRIIKVE